MGNCTMNIARVLTPVVFLMTSNFVGTASADSLTRKPNVLVIYADDQGSVDANCYGAEDLQTPLEGFSYPTVVLQLHHVIAAERYWFSVLQGGARLDDDAAGHGTVEALRSLEREVAASTRSYLRTLADEETASKRSTSSRVASAFRQTASWHS